MMSMSIPIPIPYYVYPYPYPYPYSVCAYVYYVYPYTYFPGPIIQKCFEKSIVSIFPSPFSSGGLLGKRRGLAPRVAPVRGSAPGARARDTDTEKTRT